MFWISKRKWYDEKIEELEKTKEQLEQNTRELEERNKELEQRIKNLEEKSEQLEQQNRERETIELKNIEKVKKLEHSLMNAKEEIFGLKNKEDDNKKTEVFPIAYEERIRELYKNTDSINRNITIINCNQNNFNHSIQNITNDIFCIKQEMKQLWNEIKLKEENVAETVHKKENNKTIVTAIFISENYIKTINKQLEKLKDILLRRNYIDLKETIEEALENFDIDDLEEVISPIHSSIEKNILGSFSKVKKEECSLLEEFLISIGYQEIPVRVGDKIKQWVSYFSNIFQEACTDDSFDGTISNIYIKPYELKYRIDDEEETLLLKGQCCFYKKAQ